MAQIKWKTASGSLGTFAESLELRVQLAADNPLAVGVTPAGFDPRTAFVGNGTTDQVSVSMPITKDQWRIRSMDLPGSVVTGEYPNTQNPNQIQPQRIDVRWPYRGGRNEASLLARPVADGIIGISAVGIPFYNASAGVRVAGQAGTAWTLNAPFAKVFGEDKFGGYPDQQGQYHYHDSQFINNNAWNVVAGFAGGSYRHADGHSKIIGWAADGYPIYGPYGYVSLTHAGEVQHMVSGYTTEPVPGTPGETYTRFNRPLPATAVVTKTFTLASTIKVSTTVGFGVGARLKGGTWPENSVYVIKVIDAKTLVLNTRVNVDIDTVVQATYPMGIFVEDWHYTAPLGTTLDIHNGRFCVTPEFPQGTYAYFATQNSLGEPTFPYIIGKNYKGNTELDGIPGVADLTGTFVTEELVYTLQSGSLPSGVKLYPTGLLYGFPVVTTGFTGTAASYEFTVRAKNSRNQVADRTFVISVNNIVPPVITTATDLGTVFDNDLVKVAVSVTEVNTAATLVWSVSKGTLPLGLKLTQAGVIQGFALSPPAGGAAGSTAYDNGLFDQFTLDYDGATLSRTYQFTIRVFDGISFTEKDFSMKVLARSFFRADNGITTIDTDDVFNNSGLLIQRTVFTADRDGFNYPSVTTDPASLPVVKQDTDFAFQFSAYYSNPNVKIKWAVSDAGADAWDEFNFDTAAWDQTNLSLPPGLYIDTETGWLTGLLGKVSGLKQFYDFKIQAYVEVPISLTQTDKRFSTPVSFRLQVNAATENAITWVTPGNLGEIDNGKISTLFVKAAALDGQALTYSLRSTMKELQLNDPNDQRVVSNTPSRLPQGLKLLPSGLLSGRPAFDFMAPDRAVNETIQLSSDGINYDAVFTFVVTAITADGLSYGNQTFTLKVRNINIRPFENLYMRSLASPDIRSIFHSVLSEAGISTNNIYRADDPYFGIPKYLSFLAVPGLRSDTPEHYINAMAHAHRNKDINFGDLKTAVATDNNLNPIYEVLYVDIAEPGNPTANSAAIARTYRDASNVTQNLLIESDSFPNMTEAMINGVGYEYQGALPDWMVTLQPDTKRSLGFKRAVILAYVMPGNIERVKYAWLRSLIRGNFSFRSMFQQFSFVADRYQWDLALSVNYDSVANSWLATTQTTFDVSPSIGVVDRGPWLVGSAGTTQDLRGVSYNGTNYVAVGQNNTLLTSRGGQTWSAVPQNTDFNYQVSVLSDVPANTYYLIVPTGQSVSVGDEVLQVSPWSSVLKSNVKSITYSVNLSVSNGSITSAVSNAIPAGTYIESVDQFGTTAHAVLTQNAAIGDLSLSVDSVLGVPQGLKVYVAGLPQRLPVAVGGISGTYLILSGVTTNAIASGTTLVMNDQLGNVYAVTTANATNSGAGTIYTNSDFSTFANTVTRASAYTVTTGGLLGVVLGSSANVEMRQPPAATIRAGSQLSFAHRITQNSPAGTSVIYFSNTDRITVNSAVTSLALTSGSFPSAAWTANSQATINSLRITLPTATLNGRAITNMDVVAPGLPGGTKVVQSSTHGSQTYIDVNFAPTSGIGTRGLVVARNDLNSLTLANTVLAHTITATSIVKGSSVGTVIPLDSVANLLVRDILTTTNNVNALFSANVTTIFNNNSSVLIDQAQFIPQTQTLNFYRPDTGLDYDLASTSLLTFDDYTGVTQDLLTDRRTPAGTNTITFSTYPGRSLVNSRVKILGLSAGTTAISIADNTIGGFTRNNDVGLSSPVQYVIGRNIAVNFRDTQGNLTYYVGAAAKIGDTNLSFTSNVMSTMIGARLSINSFSSGTTITSVDTQSNTITINQSTVGLVANTANIKVILPGGTVKFLYANANVGVGTNIIPIYFGNSSDYSIFNTFASASVSMSGFQIATSIVSTAGARLTFDLNSNAIIPLGQTITATSLDGFASVNFVVSNVTPQFTTAVNVTVAPVRNTIGSLMTIQGLPTVVNVASTSGNVVNLDQASTDFIPQYTTLQFDDTYGHVNNLQVITDYTSNTTNFLLTTPAVGTLVGSYVPLNGNATLSLTTVSVVDTGTTVASKTPTQVTLSKPLIGTVQLGFDDSITFGLSSADYNSITYVNGRWVAVGSKAVVLSQDTLGNWNQRTAYFYGDLLGVTASPDLYVAVGTSGLIVTSSDLENWVARAGNTGQNLRSVAYGRQSQVLTGVTLNNTTAVPATPGFVSNLHLGAKIAVATTTTYTTYNTVVTGNVFANISASNTFVWGNLASTVANTGLGSLTSGLIVTSRDRNNAPVIQLNNNVTVVKVTGGNVVQLSSTVNAAQTDVLTFQSATTQTIENAFTVPESQGVTVQSASGAAFTLTSPITTGATDEIFVYNDTWITVSDGGVVQNSTNGITWTDITTQVWGTTVPRDLKKVKFINNKWIIVGALGTVLTSPDGVTWNLYNAGTTSTLNDVVYSQGIYFAVGNNGVIVESKNTTLWTVSSTNVTNTLAAITSDGVSELVVGTGGTVLASSGFYVVDWAVRNVTFEVFNNNSVNELTILGYPVVDGQTLVFAQQFGFDPVVTGYRGQTFENDGWNQYTNVYDGTGFDPVPTVFDYFNVVPGFDAAQADPTVINQRGGIWRVNVSNNFVTLTFVRPVELHQIVFVKNENTKLVYNKDLSTADPAPTYKPVQVQGISTTSPTSFDGSGTRFANNRDQYTEPGQLDKYLKFPKIGVFR